MTSSSAGDQGSCCSGLCERNPPEMEPPPRPPASMETTGVGETQQDVLLEVLRHCRFLHAAVQRLEQKIDNLQLRYRNLERSGKVNVMVGEDQLSWSLAQRLGPSPQTEAQRNPAGASVVLHGVGGKRSKRRRRRAQRASGETNMEELGAPQDNKAQKKRPRKARKRHAETREAGERDAVSDAGF